MRTMKESGAKIKAKNSEQWAAQKAAENERDKAAVFGAAGEISCCLPAIFFQAPHPQILRSVQAILELNNMKDQAEAAQIKAESQVRMCCTGKRNCRRSLVWHFLEH